MRSGKASAIRDSPGVGLDDIVGLDGGDEGDDHVGVAALDLLDRADARVGAHEIGFARTLDVVRADGEVRGLEPRADLGDVGTEVVDPRQRGERLEPEDTLEERRRAVPHRAELAGLIGDPQVRSRGTLGGSIANNDPAADYPAAVLALGATIINGSAVPALSTRNFQTTVELQEGQTLAVAGLLQNRSAGNSARTLFLADIPIVNRLTGIDRVQSSEQELVILVTPRLVGPMDPEKVGPLPGNDLFEPSNIEFYLLGRIESRRNKDYRAPVMTDMHRRLNYLKCQEFYMNGPTGHAASAPLLEE